MTQTTDNELAVKCMDVLLNAVGPVDAARFVGLVVNSTFDYTEWRKSNLFQGETVDSLCDQIERFQSARSGRVSV